MSKIQYFYCHEDGSISQFQPSEIQRETPHVITYIHDPMGHVGVVFAEIPPGVDPDDLSIRAADAFLESTLSLFIGVERSINSVVMEDVSALDVPDISRAKSLTTYIEELVQEDREVDEMDRDGVEEFDLDDPDYNDVDEESGENDDDGEDLEGYSDSYGDD